MTQRALSLPEIRDHIGIFLSKNALLNCILVSQDWYRSFEPYLYYGILTPQSDTSMIYWPPLDRFGPKYENEGYARHVRRLALNSDTPAEYLVPNYINLEYLQLFNPLFRTINLESLTTIEVHRNRIADFVQRHHTNLEHVKVMGYNGPISKNFWDLLTTNSMFPKLRKITIQPNMEGPESNRQHSHTLHMDADISELFWKACTKLKSLELQDFRPAVPDQHAWPEFPHLENLFMLDTTGWKVSKQAAMLGLLAQSPQLKCLSWVLNFDEYLPSTEAEDLHQGALTNAQIIEGMAGIATSHQLQSLECLELTLYPDTHTPETMSTAVSKAMATFLNALATPLSVLHIDNFDFDAVRSFPSLQRHLVGLRDLNIGLPEAESSQMRLRLLIEVDPEETTEYKTYRDQQLFALKALSNLTWLESINLSGRWNDEELQKFIGVEQELKSARYNEAYRLDLRVCQSLGYLDNLKNLSYIYFWIGPVWEDDEIMWAMEYWPNLRDVGSVYPEAMEDCDVDMQ
ncbi:hypothetical protein BG011_006114 [Mortierella polycephala]|uniref:Uncharacterized protein n=1 Tax=Mortierella polycephala TaxID=41804 RepID=A0A9P6U010_9FUNG|nr:hypothetical protein BG011_006114 [Mortierella polycephala]